MIDPLHTLHEQANAEFQPYGPVQIVSTFGVPQAEYAAIHKACGLMDLPQRGVIELTGKDRLAFLNNLLTNQTFDKQAKSPLPAGTGVYAFLLNAKTGRIIVDVNVIELGNRTLLELDARLIDAVLPQLEKYRFAEQVQIVSRREDLHEIALYGPGAMELLKQTVDSMPALDAPMSCGSARVIGQDVTIWRDDPCGVPGLHLIMAAQSAEAVWSHLLTLFAGSISPSPGTPAFGSEAQARRGEGRGEGLSLPIANRKFQIANPEGPHPNPLPEYRARGPEGKRRLRLIGWAAFNACRIEAGRPIFGIDFDDSVLPAETGQLARAVSFTKGCYPGQEVVARMHARQQVARQLVGLKMESDALPIAGAQIFDDKGNAIGGVTSSTISPILSNAALCIGLVKKPFFAVGTKLTIPAEGAMRSAVVVVTPFVKD